MTLTQEQAQALAAFADWCETRMRAARQPARALAYATAAALARHYTRTNT